MCIYNSYTRVFLCAHAYTRVHICYAHEHKRKALRVQVQVGIVRCSQRGLRFQSLII